MIKNIIFDLGGVILNIDYRLTSKAFQKLGITDFDDLYSQAKQSALFDDLETGKITPENFRNQVRDLIKMNLHDNAIDSAWNAMLLDLPKERINILQSAKKNYQTFLLSNTNAIHLDAYTKDLQEKHGIQSLGKLFNKEYFSHKIQLRKPDIEAFEYVLNENHLIAEETLFIDDSIQHLAGAKELGIKTYFMDASQQLSISHLFENGKLREEMLHG